MTHDMTYVNRMHGRNSCIHTRSARFIFRWSRQARNDGENSFVLLTQARAGGAAVSETREELTIYFRESSLV